MLCGRKRTDARSVCNRKLNGMDHVMVIRMSRSGGGRLCVTYPNRKAGPPVAAKTLTSKKTRERMCQRWRPSLSLYAYVIVADRARPSSGANSTQLDVRSHQCQARLLSLFSDQTNGLLPLSPTT